VTGLVLQDLLQCRERLYWQTNVMCHYPNRGKLPYAILDKASQSVTANNRCGIISALCFTAWFWRLPWKN